MNLTFYAQPAGGGGCSQHDGALHAYGRPLGYLEVSFCTGDIHQRRYWTRISHGQFEELAKVMVEVNPEAAIEAFGAAIQGVSVTVTDAKTDATELTSTT